MPDPEARSVNQLFSPEHFLNFLRYQKITSEGRLPLKNKILCLRKKKY